MPGLVPGIYIFLVRYFVKQDVDGQDNKPGHDGAYHFPARISSRAAFTALTMLP